MYHIPVGLISPEFMMKKQDFKYYLILSLYASIDNKLALACQSINDNEYSSAEDKREIFIPSTCNFFINDHQLN